MLKKLNTLHKPDKVFPTAGNPLLVLCDDLQDWVCKHSRESSKLVNELLGSCFAVQWNLHTPEISLISVKKEHIPANLQGINFSQSCFGSKYIKSSKELDYPTIGMFMDYNFRRKIESKHDFLLICLFDIWLSNEDRNHNNTNLLLDFSDIHKIRFTVFDHDSIFNSNNLRFGIYHINEFDSLLYSELGNILYKNKQSLVNTVDNIAKKFYICVANCEDNLRQIIDLIPDDWGIDRDHLEHQLRDNLFTKNWLRECENNFRSFVQTNII
tara:strand:- start:38403 stop:39209 length:807 start_codon:yes stop_codon:yes gene_type:complete